MAAAMVPAHPFGLPRFCSITDLVADGRQPRQPSGSASMMQDRGVKTGLGVIFPRNPHLKNSKYFSRNLRYTFPRVVFKGQMNKYFSKVRIISFL